jgi:hypothetical protein
MEEANHLIETGQKAYVYPRISPTPPGTPPGHRKSSQIGDRPAFLKILRPCFRGRRFLTALMVKYPVACDDTGGVASRLSPFPLALQSAVLGCRIPAGNVHGLHPQAFRGDRCCADRSDPQGLRLRCHGCMGTDVWRNGPCDCQQVATTTAVQIGRHLSNRTCNPGTAFCLRPIHVLSS